MTTQAPVREIAVPIELRGGNWDAYNAQDAEILVEGGTGTGKTFGLLLKRNQNAQEYEGYRGLIVRKTAVTLASTILRTFEEEVLHEWDRATQSSKLDGVHYFGGSQHEPAAYVYDNGSRIVVGGMDAPSKVLGTDYDEVYYNEVTEGSIEDIETLLSRLRHGVMPYQQLIMDCNPTYDRHPILLRALSGQTRRIRTTLKDNPAFYDRDGNMTPRGEAYLRSLSGLTGTRYQRLVLGEWVGMENAIYADYLKPETMLVEIPEHTQWTGRAITGVDYGETPSHPSTVGTITEATTGVWWARKCWCKTGGNTQEIEDEVRSQRVQFGAKLVCTDPTLRAWAQSKGWYAADGAAGSRSARVGKTVRLLEVPALKFDKYGEGIQELWDEMQMYRWETIETDTELKQVPVRKDDDRVAQLEYSVEGIDMLVQLPRTIAARPVAAGARRQVTGWRSA